MITKSLKTITNDHIPNKMITATPPFYDPVS